MESSYSSIFYCKGSTSVISVKGLPRKHENKGGVKKRKEKEEEQEAKEVDPLKLRSLNKRVRQVSRGL